MLSILTNNVVAGAIIFTYRDEYVIPMICSWTLMCADLNSQFLMDIYVIITVLLFLFVTYSNEYEKALTLICSTICLNWFIDNYHGQSPMTDFDQYVSIAFLFLLLSALKPLREEAFITYLCICLTLLEWIVFKYYRIAMKHGVLVHPYQVYAFETLLHFNLTSFFGPIFFPVTGYMSQEYLAKMVAEKRGSRDDIQIVTLNVNNSSSLIEFAL